MQVLDIKSLKNKNPGKLTQLEIYISCICLMEWLSCSLPIGMRAVGTESGAVVI